ncbi:MAG: energy transducer TonB [Balneola sp.]|nr:MAG: energy transducer TonB [Balneola sp.]
MIKKKPRANLRAYHTIFTQIGIICALLFLIAATNIRFEVIEKPCTICEPPTPDPFDVVDVPITKEPERPAPHKPSVFIEVPTDDPIEPDPIVFLDFAPDDPIPFSEPEATPPEDTFEPLPEFMPEMKGGLKKLYSEIEYPDMARQIGVEGRVTVQFIVNEQGEVEDPTIIRGIGGGCDKEVLRVIKKMKFTPGIQNGKFVRVRMHQTVTFKLQN